MKAKLASKLKLVIALIVVVALGATIYLYANSYLIKGSMLPIGKKANIQLEKKLLPAGNGMGARQFPGGNGAAVPTDSRSIGDPGGGF